MRPHARRDPAAARPGDADDLHRAREHPGRRERQERELDRGREAAGRRDVLRAADALAMELGQPVDEELAGEHVRVGMRRPVVLRVGRRVSDAEVAGEIDDARSRGHDLGHLRGAHAVRQPEEDDIHPARGLACGQALEAQIGPSFEVRVDRRDRLPHEVDGHGAHQIDLRVHEQMAHELCAAVARGADDRGLEALRHAPTVAARVLGSPAMASHADEATAWLSDKTRAMSESIAPLVEINSFTENPEGGRKVGALLRELFARDGVEAAVRPSERFARPPGVPLAAGAARIAAPWRSSATSTPSFRRARFEGYRADDAAAHGPGVLDMKGGLVVIAFALRALAATGGLDAVVPVRVVVVSDEEVGSPEGQGVIAAAITGSSACLVFEAGRAADAIITRRKGTGAMTAIAHGRAAHAGNAHEDGANAIWAAARFVDAVQRLTDYARGVTVNVGRIAGGHSKNTVPDRAEAQVDLRFRTRADGEQLALSIRHAAEDAAAGVPGTRIELHGGIARPPLERTEASARLCAEYAACARAHGLGGEEAPLIGGGSDASTAARSAFRRSTASDRGEPGSTRRTSASSSASLVPKAQALARFLAQRARG